MQFTDSHCHLDDKAFKAQLPELLAKCQQLAIKRIIVPSIAPDNFTDVLNLAKTYHQNPIEIYPCLGIHPWFLQSLNDNHLAQLTSLAENTKTDIIAIGEIGLDGAIAKKAPEQYGQSVEDNWRHQQHFFDYQLHLAKQNDLPVIVHHRQSHDKIVPMLKQHKLERAGIIHGFTGSYQQAVAYLDLGFKLGVGSTITYSRAKKTINCIKRLPLNSLVLETDAPSMPLSNEVLTNLSDLRKHSSNTSHKTSDNTCNNTCNNASADNLVSTVNSPTNIKVIFETLTSIREESTDEIAEQLELTLQSIFFR